MRIKKYIGNDLFTSSSYLIAMVNNERRNVKEQLKKCGLTFDVECRITAQRRSNGYSNNWYLVIRNIPFRVWWKYIMQEYAWVKL